LNLTVSFHAECLSFSEKRYLAIGGTQLTIWEEVTLNEGSARAWFNVHSAVMPRAFVEVRFSPCERLFATAESMVINNIIEWNLIHSLRIFLF
jgi:hypothetical protein